MFNGLERRHGIKEAKEVDLKSLQVEVWLGADGAIEEVNESAHLGTQDLAADPDVKNVYRCVGAYGRPGSKIPVSFKLDSLGTVAPRIETAPGMHEVKKDVLFNALKWLDEPEKVAALSDVEIIKLQNIGVIELNDIVIAALLAVPRVWTPLVDAAMAIMQHANGSQETFPKPIITQEHNTNVVTGDHSDGAAGVLTVGSHNFTVGDKYWRFCSHGFCKGRERYAFTWMDVPVSYLDEPN
jgi:hypothetical protein